MTATIAPQIDHIAALLAKQGYDVSQTGPGILDVREVRSGISISAVLEGDIMFFTLPCMTLPVDKLTPDLMKRMLAGENGISTSSFQLSKLSRLAGTPLTGRPRRRRRAGTPRRG